jgi:DNA-binding MarR family transcriptional regulator
MTERDDPTQHLGFLLHDVARLMRRDFNRRAQHLGLTQAQWRALVFLARNEGCNQVALADMLEVQPITLARLLDRLQSAGFIERQPDPADRRAFRLYLTDKAQPVLAKIWEFGAQTREETMAGLSRPTRETLANALVSMRANLLAGEGDATPADGPAPAGERTAHG